MSTLGQQIGARRRALGLTQQQLADKLGTEQGRVSHWESGYRKPRARTLDAIAKALGCELRLVPRDGAW